MPLRESPLFSWLNTWRDDELRGRLNSIYVCAGAGDAMRAVGACECLPGQGLAGDRYATGKGHWIKTDGCEVTLVSASEIERASGRGKVGFLAGEHRRNLVVEGIPLAAMRNRRLQIGEVLFEFHRLRPPCAYLDRLLRPGAAKALGKAGGVGLKVLSEGTIRCGDPVEVIVPPAER